MALFGKKKDEGEPGGGEDVAPVTGGFQPENAKKFFERAANVFETSQYDYSVQLWLNGLAQNPGAIEGFHGFVQAVRTLVAEQGKKADARAIAKGLNGQGPIRKYQDALLAWGFKVDDPALTLKAAEAAGALGVDVRPVTMELGRLALAQARAKPKKDAFVRLMETFEKAGAFTLAVEAGDDARKLDASDGELAKRVQQLAAQSTISSGGYDETGQAGGFRKNIRDVAKQAQLAAQDSISKTDDQKDLTVRAAEADYTSRPSDTAAVEKYGRALLERGRPEDELRALTVYTKAFGETGQFRFREKAGEITVIRIRRSVAALEAKSRAKPENTELAQQLASARKQLNDKEIEELRLQVENYPTDLRRKYDLGRQLAARGEHEQAIALFQAAQDDPRIRPTVLHALARSFLALDGWADAAIDTFRQAIDMVVDEGSDTAIDLRYGLMCALQAKGEADRDADALDEADRLAGAIAMKKFGFRDVQERRKAIRAAIQGLRA